MKKKTSIYSFEAVILAVLLHFNIAFKGRVVVTVILLFDIPNGKRQCIDGILS